MNQDRVERAARVLFNQQFGTHHPHQFTHLPEWMKDRLCRRAVAVLEAAGVPERPHRRSAENDLTLVIVAFLKRMGGQAHLTDHEMSSAAETVRRFPLQIFKYMDQGGYTISVGK